MYHSFFSYDFLLINTCSRALSFIFSYQLKDEVIPSLMLYVLEQNDREILVKMCWRFYVLFFTIFISENSLNFFKTIEALNCDIGGNKVQNALWLVQNLHISSSLKNTVILCDTNNLHQDSPEDIVNGIIEIGPCFTKQHYHINVSICGLLPL